jgi:hypothetical protein
MGKGDGTVVYATGAAEKVEKSVTVWYSGKNDRREETLWYIPVSFM